jgi:hypothetical protein
MGRTFIEQDTQIYSSDTYSDVLTAGSTLQTGAANLQDDLNSIRSQLKRAIWDDGAGNWYDDIPTINSKKRAIRDLNFDLDDIEEKRLLFREQVITDIVVPAGVAATGTINAVGGANLVDGETFTLNDGIHTPTVFEFDSGGGVTGGNVAVTFTGGDSASTVAASIISAINGVTSTLFITATSGGGAVVNLTHDRQGTVGNYTITDTVADGGFTVSGMSGGAGDIVVLSAAGSETPTQTAAVNAGTANGAVVATLTTDVGIWRPTLVSGPNAISPKSLVLIRDAITNEQPIQNGNGKDIYGLLQTETGVVDGDTFNDTNHQVQISFISETTSGDGFEHVDAQYIGGRTINYSYVRRINFDAIPETAFLSGVFIDQSAAASDVTLDRAIDNQIGPATQTDRNIRWQITDTYSLDFEDSTGLRDILKIAPNGAGDAVTVDADTITFTNPTNNTTFTNGASFDTSGTQLNVGVTAGQIDSAGALTLASAGANDVRIFGAQEIFLDDGNQTGSTWAQTSGIKLSDTTQEWNDFETAFGEVSLLRAIYMARQGARTKGVAVVTANSPADTNMTGAGGTPNLDAQLPAYLSANFVANVDVYLNGVLLRNGANSAANHDVYPGTTPANGDLKFEFALKGGGSKNDVITMIVWEQS